MAKKILILEPFYTNFHIDLAQYISSDIETFIYNFGYCIYVNHTKNLLVSKSIKKHSYTQEDLEKVKHIKTLYTETSRKLYETEPATEAFIYMAKYLSFTRDYIRKNHIDIVMMHNDLRWQHALTIEVCNELNILYLITERGIFRPNTLTIDFKGVNGYSSLPKDKAFYKEYTPKSKEFHHNYKTGKIVHTKTNLKFILFIILNKIGDFWGWNSTVKNKNYSLTHYLHLFIRQKFFKVKATMHQTLPQRYLFIPLQLSTDTQILIHSKFKNIQEFISTVENDFYTLNNKNIKLVFKIHPMERGMVKYLFDERSMLVENGTNELIRKSEAIVIINSTVGFEAIKNYKKVIVLGEAFFKIEDIVVCSSKENFKNDLNYVLSGRIKPDKDLIDKFVHYVQYEYQINGNLFKYDKRTFQQIKEKINTKLAEK